MVNEGHPVYRLYKLFWDGLDWLVPPQCGGCQTPGPRWCTGCQAELSPVPQPICKLCGNPISFDLFACTACRQERPAFDRLRSLGLFQGPLQRALHRLKYRRDIGLGVELATLLFQHFTDLDWNVDAVVPVPLSKARLRSRGYNQAGLIARPLALQAGLDYRPNLLWRSRDTRSQVGLSYAERRANLRGAFESARVAAGKNLLVVDDIATTGSTLQACAAALKNCGAAAVFGLTVGRTVISQV